MAVKKIESSNKVAVAASKKSTTPTHELPAELAAKMVDFVALDAAVKSSKATLDDLAADLKNYAATWPSQNLSQLRGEEEVKSVLFTGSVVREIAEGQFAQMSAKVQVSFKDSSGTVSINNTAEVGEVHDRLAEVVGEEKVELLYEQKQVLSLDLGKVPEDKQQVVYNLLLKMQETLKLENLVSYRTVLVPRAGILRSRAKQLTDEEFAGLEKIHAVPLALAAKGGVETVPVEKPSV